MRGATSHALPRVVQNICTFQFQPRHPNAFTPMYNPTFPEVAPGNFTDIFKKFPSTWREGAFLFFFFFFYKLENTSNRNNTSLTVT